MVVVDGVGEVLEDGGDAKEDDVEQHIQQVAEGQTGHNSLLNFLLFFLGGDFALRELHSYTL